MGLYTARITAQNTSVYLCDVHKKRDLLMWVGTMGAYGTFGGGTITWQISIDGGTTKMGLKDLTGNTHTSTAEDNFTENLAGGHSADDGPLQLWVSIGAATNPNITVFCSDNRN